LLKFTPSGDWKEIADVGGVDYQFTADNPGDGTYGTEIDANPYGVLATPSGTYVADAGSNTLDWVGNNGDVSILNRFTVPPVAVFPTDGVPTCVAPSGNQLTVADLAGRIWRVSGGTLTPVQGQTGNHRQDHSVTLSSTPGAARRRCRPRVIPGSSCRAEGCARSEGSQV
jgi:hypothetical protein